VQENSGVLAEWKDSQRYELKLRIRGGLGISVQGSSEAH
jgi:hypothetical protein